MPKVGTLFLVVTLGSRPRLVLGSSNIVTYHIFAVYMLVSFVLFIFSLRVSIDSVSCPFRFILGLLSPYATPLTMFRNGISVASNHLLY